MPEKYIAVVYVEEGHYGAGTFYHGTLNPGGTCLQGHALALALEPRLSEENRKIEPWRRGNLRMYMGMQWEWLDVIELTAGRRLLIGKEVRPNHLVQFSCSVFTRETGEDFVRDLPELLAKMGFHQDEIPMVRSLVSKRFGIAP